MRKTIFIFAITFSTTLLAQERKFTFDLSAYSGEYLGLILPDTIPQKFAPGFISIENEFTQCLEFSPDRNQLVYTWSDLNWQHWGIMYSKQINNTWSKPVLLQFEGSKNVPFNPTFSRDSKKIIFSMISTTWPDTDLYSITLSDSTYSSTPERLPSPINTTMTDFGYFMDKDQDVYITGKRKDFRGGLFDIYQCHKENGKYVTKNLEVLNSALDDAAPYVSPDGSYLVYEQMVNEKGLPYNDSTARIIRIDLFVSFRNPDNSWSQPINLGPTINSTAYKTFRPTLSPDGKFLFYSQTEAQGSSVYWVSTKIIDRLRPHK